MFKLYVKTFIKSIKYVAIILGTYFLGGQILLVTLANFFKTISFIPTLIMIGVPTMIAFAISLRVRKNDRDIAKAYRSINQTKKFSIIGDLKQMIKSMRFWVETLVFVTYVMVISIVAAPLISAFPSSTIFTLIGLVLLYVVLNTTSWLLVHKAYLKDKIM